MTLLLTFFTTPIAPSDLMFSFNCKEQEPLLLLGYKAMLRFEITD